MAPRTPAGITAAPGKPGYARLLVFFDPIKPRKDPPRPKRRVPRRAISRFSRPDGTVPGGVALELVLAQSGAVVVGAGEFAAYKVGFECELLIVTFDDDLDFDFAMPDDFAHPRRRRREGPEPGEIFRFGVEYSDGSKAAEWTRGFAALEGEKAVGPRSVSGREQQRRRMEAQRLDHSVATRGAAEVRRRMAGCRRPRDAHGDRRGTFTRRSRALTGTAASPPTLSLVPTIRQTVRVPDGNGSNRVDHLHRSRLVARTAAAAPRHSARSHQRPAPARWCR